MKRWRLHIILLLLPFLSISQSFQIDSLKAVVESSTDDTVKVNNLLFLSTKFYRTSTSDATRYASQAKELAERINYQKGVAYALKSMGMAYYVVDDYAEVLLYWQQSLNTFEEIGDKLGYANMLNNLGAVNFNGGDDAKAIDYYLRSLKVSEEIGDTLRIATALVNIGAVYFNKESTHDEAKKYYLKALPLSEELGDHDAIGTSAVNIGEIYLENQDADSALYYFEKSLAAYQKSESGNVAYALFNIGRVYTFRKDFSQAIKYQEDAYNLASKQGAKLEMAQSLLGLAVTYKEQGDTTNSIQSFLKAETIAKEIGANYELKSSYYGLAELYGRKGDYKNGYKYQTLYASIKDTLYNDEIDKQLKSQALVYELGKKDTQIDLMTKDKELQDANLQRQKIAIYAAGITGFLFLLLAIGLYSRYKYVRKTKMIIEYEKERSDNLLLNILPVETAEELKTKGSATPKHYDLVSVLFTDFKGFTKIAEKLTPQELVAELDNCFLAFDRIIDRYNLEKIKTIGDAYMCAGGIPVANTTNPVDIVKAALEIKAFMDDMKKDRESRGLDYWELRIGIHTGPVIAGVVGKKKFAYDIWGDAVNTASRMESSGIPGQVNISGTTYEYIKDQFDCTYRGKIDAKNKGQIDMYIIDKINEAALTELSTVTSHQLS